MFKKTIALAALLLSISANATDTTTHVSCFGNGSASVYSRSSGGVSYSSVNCSHSEQQTSITPSEVAINQSYSPRPYTSLILSGALTVALRTGDEDSVTISGDRNEVASVEVDSIDGKLTIHKPSTGNNHLRVTIVSATLQQLEISGAGDTDIDGNFPHGLFVRKGGAGNVNIAGQASHLELNLSGAGNTTAKNLETNVVHVDATGAGKISACAKKAVAGSLTGAVYFKIYCNPLHRAINTQGAAHVKYQ